jgi:hypothetical protein
MTKLPAGLDLNARIEKIERAHPELLIAAPFATASGRWEVSEPDCAAKAYESGFKMIDDLEKRYPPKPES